jgi:hypothetical protein
MTPEHKSDPDPAENQSPILNEGYNHRESSEMKTLHKAPSQK